MLCSVCYVCYVLSTFGIQQRVLVLETLKIVSCGNITLAIAVLTALS